MRLISYLRVSTARQGFNGLGIDSQREMIRSYATRINGEIISEYVEVESGTAKKQRVEIHKALAECKKQNATLIVAKLDRLARSTTFVLSVIDSGVEVIFTDMPNCNRMIITIIAAIAEYEAQLISDRVKAALKQAKLRGTILGNPNIKQASIKGGLARAKQAREQKTQSDKSASTITLLRDDANMTFENIATRLNATGHRATGDKKFTKGNVKYIYEKAKQSALVLQE